MARHGIVWRIIGRGYGTLTEIQTSWSFDDIMRADAVIEQGQDYEEAQNKRAAGPRGGKP